MPEISGSGHLLGKYNRMADLLSVWSNSVNGHNELKMLVPGACWVNCA